MKVFVQGNVGAWEKEPFLGSSSVSSMAVLREALSHMSQSTGGGRLVRAVSTFLRKALIEDRGIAGALSGQKNKGKGAIARDST